MSVTLPELPYPKNALTPHISEETLNYHYDKHHKTYVNKLNSLIENTQWAKSSLEDMVKESTDAVFNNAAQVWNHTFYWNCLSPAKQASPVKEVVQVLEKAFGSLEQFKEEFTKCAIGQFGSGWAWLIKNKTGALQIVSTSNADTPLQQGHTPLLTCDVWEHAYYIDYRNARPQYLKAFWQIVNWNFLAKNLQNG